LLLNEGNDKHIAAKLRIAGILGHGVQNEYRIETPDLEQELGITCYQFDLLLGILIIEIDGEDHKGKGKRNNDKRRDHYLKSKGYIVVRLNTEGALTESPILILTEIIYQIAKGTVYS
jgi:very-short-patch-repair endonuclease